MIDWPGEPGQSFTTTSRATAPRDHQLGDNPRYGDHQRHGDDRSHGHNPLTANHTVEFPE